MSTLSGQLKHVSGWYVLADIGVLRMNVLSKVDWLQFPNGEAISFADISVNNATNI